jgi:hypothetical protein
MHWKTRLIVLVAIAATVAAGCDPGGAKSATVAPASGLIDDESAPDTEVATDTATPEVSVELDAGLAAIPTDDSTPEDLEVKWTDSAEAEPVSKLAFTVTNRTESKIKFQVAVVADGVIGNGEKKLGKHNLSAGETEEIEINSSVLPIRSDVSVSQISVKLTWTIDTPEGPREISQRRGDRFYKHLPGYMDVRVYTKEALLDELDGVIFSMPVEDAESLLATDDIIGDVAGPKGFKEVKKSESEIASYDEYGNLVSVTASIRFVEGYLPEEEAEIFTDFAVDEEETEEVLYE